MSLIISFLLSTVFLSRRLMWWIADEGNLRSSWESSISLQSLRFPFSEALPEITVVRCPKICLQDKSIYHELADSSQKMKQTMETHSTFPIPLPQISAKTQNSKIYVRAEEFFLNADLPVELRATVRIRSLWQAQRSGASSTPAGNATEADRICIHITRRLRARRGRDHHKNPRLSNYR